MHNAPSDPIGPNPDNPYQAGPLGSATPHADGSIIHESAPSAWPITYLPSQSNVTGVVLPLVAGFLLLGFAMVMFLIHLFLIDGNQIGLHMSSTAPAIGGVFMLMSAWSNSKAVREIRLWPEGIELIRKSSQKIPWDSIKAVRVADSTNPGTINQKVITLAGADNEPIGTISGSFKQHEEIVRQIRSIASVPEPETGTKQQASKAGKKKGRRTALLTGFGALLLGSAGVFLPIKAYQDYNAAKLIESNSVLSTGVVTERIVAPNGRTLRVRYDVIGSEGSTASHNVEVTEDFYSQVAVGDQVEIRTVPDRPDLSELVVGEIKSSDFLETPLVTLLLGIVGIVATVFMVPVTILSWKGYDVDFNNGRFRVVPLE